ncbi:MAG: hypothetical protein RL764_546 [Pseudomonadota bacterium]|jgi:hypothetical protein
MNSSFSTVLVEFHAGWRRLTGIVFVSLIAICITAFDGLPDASARASASFYKETDYSNPTRNIWGEEVYGTKMRVSVGNWDLEFRDHGEVLRDAYLKVFDAENAGFSYLPSGQRVRLSSIPTYGKAVDRMACVPGTVTSASVTSPSEWFGSSVEGFEISCFSWPFVTNIFLSIALISLSPFLLFKAFQWIRDGFR